MVYTELRKQEEEALNTVNPAVLAGEMAESQEDTKAVVEGAPDDKHFERLTALPVDKNGILEKEFWGYYLEPWRPFFWDYRDPFDDYTKIWWGPRGGGKTISGVSNSIVDGQMKGIPCISNVPFKWIAKGKSGKLYKVESLPFDQEMFAKGNTFLMYKRLLIDEANYSADRLRSTSNKNLAMTDILQQSRKFRMCVDFATINWMWLDPRLTGSLCDITIECNDLFYKPYAKKHGLKKGHRIKWDMTDQTGKKTGRQFSDMGSTTFNARLLWQTYNTFNFVNPQEARRKLQSEQKMITDDRGNEMPRYEWLEKIRNNIVALAQTEPVWESSNMWDTLGISDPTHRSLAARYLSSQLGIRKVTNHNKSKYDLSDLVVEDVAK